MVYWLFEINLTFLQLTKIGQGNPLWPEAYIEIPYSNQTAPNSVNGDSITTRCIFDSRGASGNTNTSNKLTHLMQHNIIKCKFDLQTAVLKQLGARCAFLMH